MDIRQNLIGTSAVMRDVYDELECAARSDAKVLITGESGVGKEVIAKLIHHGGRRRPNPFVAINCAGVPDSLLESELFGHMRGSFTDAHRDSRGWLEQAQSGTVFLDEVGEMSLRMQAVLLRFLENGEIQRVGSDRVHTKVDVRIIAATNRNLHHEMTEKRFREDLYYRLNVIQMSIPPLRDRKEDLPLLIKEFMRRYSEVHGFPQAQLLDETMDLLLAYSWPGNVRELKNVAERLVIRARSEVIPPSDLPKEILGGSRPVGPVGAETAGQAVAEELFDRLTVGRESFWTVAYEPFMARDLTRKDLRALISRGLEHTRGNYKLLVELFNIDAGDYKRFLSFLRKYECHMPFQKFRSMPARADNEPSRMRSSLEKAI
jgi:DNA-binding NtrC family response regulator